MGNRAIEGITLVLGTALAMDKFNRARINARRQDAAEIMFKNYDNGVARFDSWRSLPERSL